MPLARAPLRLAKPGLSAYLLVATRLIAGKVVWCILPAGAAEAEEEAVAVAGRSR